ncbi:DUF5906 domain-containing protein [Pseudomonas sp. BF-R-21]|uniref:DUF5906 domain-containing protein n=1 Tax=Pseudomonas sp. BF-R-21 TaxID=2832387 RepID=UPI001CBFABD8|nr:DUF5906 domain-containing protein [Pseudomonas sp. BF-R-21]
MTDHSETGKRLSSRRTSGANPNICYQIALSSSRESPHITHKSPSWAELVRKLSTPKRTPETFAEYLAMSKDEQCAVKDVGAFVAGSFKGFSRRKDKQVDRTLLTLDIDEPGVSWPELRAAVKGEYAGLQYAAHTTHKHCFEQPRLRVVFTLSRPVDDLEYQAICRRIAEGLDPSMTWVDRCSFDFSRLMFWPSAASDGEFEAWSNDGAILDVDDELAHYVDHTDPTKWPRREDEDAHAAQMTREDPREKRGIIGAFCRLYDILRCLDELLPGVYEPTDADDRFTYTGGTTSGGARLYLTPDGFPAFLHSEHDHDPAHGQHVAWDLVRLHLGLDDAGMEAYARELPDVAESLWGQLTTEFEPIVPEDGEPERKRFAWLADWVFCTAEGKFFNTAQRGQPVGLLSFNGMFDRYVVKELGTDKKGLPVMHASDVALVLRPVPTVKALQYWPGEQAVYEVEGVRYANSYRDLRPEPVSLADSAAVRMLLVHLENLFPDDGDSQDMVLDFIAHLVRYPERRLQYALLIRGAETDGKTFFAEVMRCLLGTSNWMTIGNDQIKEQYSAWLEGHLLVCVEEIKQHGQDAQDTINRLKPYITNNMVGVRAMRQDMRRIRNFVSFFLTTNFGDALPLDDGDSRYCVLSTRFTNKAEVTEWADGWASRHGGQPFYKALYDSLKGTGPGELRAWLDARPFSRHYKPDLRAPDTMAKAMMVEAARSDADTLLAELLDDDSAPSITHDFVVLPDFKDMANRRGEPLPSTFTGRTVARFMLSKGYLTTRKCRAGARTVNVWVRNPAWLSKDGSQLTGFAIEQIKKAAIAFKKLNPI